MEHLHDIIIAVLRGQVKAAVPAYKVRETALKWWQAGVISDGELTELHITLPAEDGLTVEQLNARIAELQAMIAQLGQSG